MAPKKDSSLLPKGMAIVLAQEVGSDFEADLAGEAQVNVSTSFFLAQELNNKNSISVSIAYTDQVNDPEVGAATNTALTWQAHEMRILNDKAVLIQRVSTFLPTNLRDREDNSFQTAFSYAPRLIFSFKDNGTPLEWIFTPSIRRNVHEFSTNKDSRFNVEYTLGLSADATYDYSDRIQFSLGGIYALNRTYNEINKEVFSLSQEMNILLSKQIIMGMGHRNGGSTLRADGSSNLGIYDKINSEYFASLIYSM